MKSSPILRPNPLLLLKLAWNAPKFLQVFWRLYVDRRVPLFAKAIATATVVWVISPFDFDWMPFAGWIDDVLLMLFCGRLFVHFCPADVVQEHIQAVERKSQN